MAINYKSVTDNQNLLTAYKRICSGNCVEISICKYENHMSRTKKNLQNNKNLKVSYLALKWSVMFEI